MDDVRTLAWPPSRLAEALGALAEQSGFAPAVTELPSSLPEIATAELGIWIEATAAQLGVEAQPVEASYADVESLVSNAGPALLRLPTAHGRDQVQFLAILKSTWRGVILLGSDSTRRRVQPQLISDMLYAELEEPYISRAEELLSDADVSPERRGRAWKSMLWKELRTLPVTGCWLIRLRAGASLWRHIRQARLFRPLLILLGGHLMTQLLVIFSWMLLGSGLFDGYFERAWLHALALVLLSIIPFQVLNFSARSLLAVRAGAMFKQRLLAGALQLDPDEMRHLGAGSFLGRVMESEAVEQLALNGGFIALVAIINLTVATIILALGAGGLLHAISIAWWTLFAFFLGWRYFQQGRAWVGTYREMTNDLVEQMTGQRTRLAQATWKELHAEEDQALSYYLTLSRKFDRVGSQLNTLVPRGWLLLGLAGLAISIVFVPATSVRLAISVGGILLAFQAFDALTTGMAAIVSVVLAWRQVGPIFKTAMQEEFAQPPDLKLAIELDGPKNQDSDTAKSTEPVLFARDLVFRRQERNQTILRRCNLRIAVGERVLLEGASGSGKSTLAAVLAGLRQPESGLLLLWGYDFQTIGADAWRRRVALAPQFHENHVFSETFAFNLLMGRRWPPRAEDLEDALAICRELGLDELLERMPARLHQFVGESGWQLSHGERSRLYIARALLQDAALIVLDESFAALDPQNLQRTLRCVLNHAPSALIIAHS